MADGKKDRVGIVGAGRMGLAMLKHLVAKGYAVTVCDISEKQREAARAAACEHGARHAYRTARRRGGAGAALVQTTC